MWLYYLIAVLIMSFITFILYGLDKSKAKKNKRRIRESTLLLCSFFLDALGGYTGMLAFHHKTKHWYFQVVNIFSLAIHAVIFYYLLKLKKRVL